MSSTMRGIARVLVTGTTAAALVLSALPAAAASTLDELIALNTQAWAGEPELLDQTYAQDGTHTATFWDVTTEYVGPAAIAPLADLGWVVPTGPRIDLPAAEGEWRWVDFATLAGGTACLWHAVDGRIARHDCLVPEESRDSKERAEATDDAAVLASVEDLTHRLNAAWRSDTTADVLGEIYAPDAVHSARFLDRSRSYEGPAGIVAVASQGLPMAQVGDLTAFEAPEGELAWAQVVDLAGGSVCLFRAVDGMVTRHDCLVPVHS